MVVSQKNSWFWEENKLLYSGKVLIIAWPMYLDLRKPLLWRNGSLFLHEIWQIHKQHVNEENCVQPKVTIAVQLSYWRQNVVQITKNSKWCPGRWINRSCVVVKQWIINSVLCPYLCKFLFLTITLRILVKFWCFFFRATLGGN